MKNMSIFMAVAPIFAIGAILLLACAGVALVAGYLAVAAWAFALMAAIHLGLKFWYKQITIGEWK